MMVDVDVVEDFFLVLRADSSFEEGGLYFSCCQASSILFIQCVESLSNALEVDVLC